LNGRFFTRWSWRAWLLLFWTVVVLATVVVLEIGTLHSRDDEAAVLFLGFLVWGFAVVIGLAVISLISAVARWVESHRAERDYKKAKRAKRDADGQAVGF